MSRDLSTIAAMEQETRKRLKDLRLALFNKRESLVGMEAEERALLDTLSGLEAEAIDAFARARAIGSKAEEAEPIIVIGGAPSAPDALITAAFDAATTPQDVGDKTHIFGNGRLP